MSYPTARGTKSGWVKTSSFLTRTTGPGCKSKGAFVSYRRPGGARYGKVFANDELVVLGTNGSWTQYRYPVSGGYKLAWSPTSVVNENIIGTKVDTTVRYPVTNQVVCGNNWGTYYSPRAKAGRPYHVGIDIKSKSGDSKIYAAASGTIAKAGWNNSNGNYVVIRHTIGGQTCYSFYAHLSRITRASGNVTAGTQIGVIGNTGSSSAGTHLHFTFASSLKAGSYYGYVPSVNGNKATYGGVTYYNPHYVIANKRLP